MPDDSLHHCAVIDIGKTNVKIHVIDEQYRSRFRRSRANKVIEQGIYPHYDTHSLWRWIRSTLRDIAHDYRIDCISITTHGATAALVHPDAGEAGLVLPIMDYEYDGVASEADYLTIRPPFSETCSPTLPAGLNLGRQIFWQQRYCERAFNGAQYILPYPQYWAWRLTGVAVAEVSSWGCHTDMWSPESRQYSSLVDHLGIRDKLPPLVAASTMIGTVTDDIVEQTGLPENCQVYAGVHDSNASYLRYLTRSTTQPFTVISTGTWSISFSSATPLNRLDEFKDMLANVDILGNPVACSRFMGGREFDVICQRTGSKPEDRYDLSDVQNIIDSHIYALPNFSEGSGPFGERRPEIRGRTDCGVALASLYCALVMDYQLDLLDADGDLIIEGAWLRNPQLCRLLAQLRGKQDIYLSSDETGTVTGAAQLALPKAAAPTLTTLSASALAGLDQYRQRWRALLSDHS